MDQPSFTLVTLEGCPTTSALLRAMNLKIGLVCDDGTSPATTDPAAKVLTALYVTKGAYTSIGVDRFLRRMLVSLIMRHGSRIDVTVKAWGRQTCLFSTRLIISPMS